MPMSLKDNLAKIRKSKGLSQTALAKAAGISQQSISRLESGADLTSKYLPQIAKALGVSVYEIDENFIPDGGAIVAAPLISWVSAGKLEKPDVSILDLSDSERVSAVGLDPGGRWIALRVSGDSMDRISPPESIIFVNLKERKLIPNACYVIEDEEGGSSYKRYRPDPARWEPVSINKKHKPYLVEGDRGPKIIGRVKRTVLDL